MTIQTLLKEVKSKNPKADLDLIRLAYDFAEEAHRGQKRLSGENYIQHSLATASNLANLGLSDTIIIAGLLHDVPEDTAKTIEDVEKEFGKEVAALVKGTTKLGKIKYRGIQRYIENLRKMFLAMADDIRIILIKFADRIHNLETLAPLPEEKRKRIALESLEIYAPIANRLGMGELKGRLEDLSFPYVLPEEYKMLTRRVKERFKEEEQYIKKAKKEVEELLREEKIEVVSIHGRAKHLYSLYQKLLKHDMDFNEIYDLIAIRIIVPTISACYATLGIIHKNWKPLKGRIKDYIATPKPNGYQSLHTTVFCLEGQVVEFQIRTPKMHEHAEFGIAAHFHYKEEGALKSKKDLRKEFAWIKDLILIQKEVKDQNQFLESIKTDIFQNHIFVFTPKGDVIDLPEGSTPVDFAYHVHTDLGNKCTGTKINEKMSKLDTKLKSGDMVEIIMDKKRKHPSTDWLEF
ncbi:MAG: hypothetical protein COY66_00415, partial [Candidatus Kerfeldbacteria bacterium CG_4_10_14_0_8_um_filter_42_10]